MNHPRREMAQLSEVLQIKNGIPDFSPLFQKVELYHPTFFQPSQQFSASHHLSDFHCLTISVIFDGSPSQWFPMSPHLIDLWCLFLSVIVKISSSPRYEDFQCLIPKLIFFLSQSLLFSLSHTLSSLLNVSILLQTLILNVSVSDILDVG